jgi:AcrR family transcriptional regulator
VLDAAVTAFAQRGYHGTSVRDLAKQQGLSVAALYHHFPTKLDVLMAIMTTVMDDIIESTEQARDGAAPDPVSRFSAAIRQHVLFHTHRQAESFVANSELRSLSGDNLAEILSRRDRQERIFADLIDDGIREGVFTVEYPAETTRAILAMCISVHTWYRADGPLTPDEVADRYLSLALRQVGVTPSGPAGRAKPARAPRKRAKPKAQPAG